MPNHLIIFYSILGLVIFSIGFIIYLWLDERSKVLTLPRKPMNLCDVHGAYPSEAALMLDIPAEDKADLKVEICPQCYADRMKKAGALK